MIVGTKESYKLTSHSENRKLSARSYPEMPMLHKKICAMLFFRKGILAVGNMDKFHITSCYLIPTGRSFFFLESTPDNERCFYFDASTSIKHYIRDIILWNHSLYCSRSITHLDKIYGATSANVTYPSLERDLLPHPPRRIGNPEFHEYILRLICIETDLKNGICCRRFL